MDFRSDSGSIERVQLVLSALEDIHHGTQKSLSEMKNDQRKNSPKVNWLSHRFVQRFAAMVIVD
jgi:hypothetical protein